LVVGLGPLGGAVAQLLTGLGSTVSGAEPNPARLAHALGRGWVASAAEPALDGGYPVVVETTGSAAGRDRAVRAAATGGTVVLVGLGAATAELPVDVTNRRELTQRGSHFWGLSTLDDIVGLYARAGARPADLVTTEYSLTDLAVACGDAATVAGKVVVRPVAAADTVGAP
jgi:threonine dehydrogenase-like Zn-dependent dehydrogenase